MIIAELEPVHALRRCLDSLLGEIQAGILAPAAPPATGTHDTLLELTGHLGAASRFLAGTGIEADSAARCRALCGAWRELPARADAGRQRRFLSDLLRCRRSLEEVTAAALLKQAMTVAVGAAIDHLTLVPASGTTDTEQIRVQETVARCAAMMGAVRFLGQGVSDSLCVPLPTGRELLRWLLTLEKHLTLDRSPAGMPLAFRRELDRCVQRCCRADPVDGLSQALWQLQLLAGALLTLGSATRQHGPAQQEAGQLEARQQRSRALLACAAQALYQRSCADRAEPGALREVLRRALLLSAAPDAGEGLPGPELALPSLPGPALAPMQALLAVLPGDDQETAWATTVSLHLYRLLVCLRLLAGGFAGSCPGETERQGLIRWQLLVASLYASANHCVQQSVVTRDDRHALLVLLGRLPLMLRMETMPDAGDLLSAALLLAARLGLRAQHHWQRLALTLDATQQDFVGVSVQRVLAAELHCLPAMGATRGHDKADLLPQEVLRDLRLLLKGARILNVQRIESLVLVMVEMYQLMVDNPAFAVTSDIGKVLPRAHRSLCRMLDQAAAWQAPGNARRVINSLYGCLERWRGDGNALTAGSFAAVRERPAGQHDHGWQMCLATNRRLRKLVRHQDDLDNIRALLLELLRSQEELIRRQAGYGGMPDARQV